MGTRHARTVGWIKMLCAAVGLTATVAGAETIVVYGASGRVGEVIVDEALQRGHDVIGVSRNPDSLATEAPNFSAVQGDVTSLESMLEIITGVDAVVITVRGIGPGNTPEEAVTSIAAETFVEAAGVLGDGAPRVIQVGGGTTLRIDGVYGFDNPEIEPGTAQHGNAFGHWRAIEIYGAADGLQWAVLTPPPGGMNPGAPGERTGDYRLGGEDVLYDAAGDSAITMADFAVAVVDEAERPQALNRRAAVGPPE